MANRLTRYEFDSSVSLFSLSELKAKCSKNKIKKLLRTFKCKRNEDLEHFFHNTSLLFENKLRSKTYLYIHNMTKNVVAYFTISIKTLSVNGLKDDTIKRLDGSDNKSICSIPCFLIGQLGKSESSSRIKGDFIINDAVEIIDQAQKSLGGRFIMIDSINNSKVILFYEKHGFLPIEEDKSSESVKMIKPYF